MYQANIKFGPVTTGTTSKGVAYAKSSAEVTTSRGTFTRTVMAFGAQLSAVKSVFRKGKSARLTVAQDGGTVKVIGFPRAPKAA